jgi:hypothetical protein
VGRPFLVHPWVTMAMRSTTRIFVWTVLAVSALFVLFLGSYWSLLLGSHAFTTGKCESPPRPELDYTSWDFGCVESGPELEARFPVHNAGGRRLILHESRSSCECVSGANSHVIVKPGETIDLAVRIATKHVRGPLKLDVQYDTNSPDVPLLSFSLLADVKSASSQGRLQPIPEPQLEPIAAIPEVGQQHAGGTHKD